MICAVTSSKDKYNIYEDEETILLRKTKFIEQKICIKREQIDFSREEM